MKRTWRDQARRMLYGDTDASNCLPTPPAGLAIPCDGEIRTVTWDVATVRRGEPSNVGSFPTGTGAALRISRNNYQKIRGNKFKRKYTINEILKHDIDLWVRINAWSGNWRRGMEGARTALGDKGRPGDNAKTVTTTETSQDGTKTTIESIQRDCNRDNSGVTRGNESQLKDLYGSYLPTEGGCDGEDQVHCKESSCRLEQIVRVTVAEGGYDPRVTVDNPRGFRINKEDLSVLPWVRTKWPSDGGELSACIRADFRCVKRVKPAYVLLPGYFDPWDPSSGIPEPGTSVPAPKPPAGPKSGAGSEPLPDDEPDTPDGPDESDRDERERGSDRRARGEDSDRASVERASWMFVQRSNQLTSTTEFWVDSVIREALA